MSDNVSQAVVAGPSSSVMGPPALDGKTGSSGLSAIFVCAEGAEAHYLYVSESIEDILGWKTKEMIGKSPYEFMDPEEIPFVEAAHFQFYMRQRTAFVMYFKWRHKQGHYVKLCVSTSYTTDKSMGLLTHWSEGDFMIQQARTAREVIEISKGPENGMSLQHHSGPGLPDSSRLTPPRVYEPEKPWPAREPTPDRTGFMLDRFTETSPVIYATNDLIVNSLSLLNQPFYSIIKPSDRDMVRSKIDSAKEWTPVRYKEGKTGGHCYATFSVLKIPDLPPAGSRMPQGTDGTERMMPGQGFILVEGIFTAGSDGVICVIERVQT